MVAPNLHVSIKDGGDKCVIPGGRYGPRGGGAGFFSGEATTPYKNKGSRIVLCWSRYDLPPQRGYLSQKKVNPPLSVLMKGGGGVGIGRSYIPIGVNLSKKW